MTLRTAAFAAALLALGPATAHAQARNTFSAPTGELGANLSTDPTQISRMHGELSFYTGTQGAATSNALVLQVGGGVKVTRNLEIAGGVTGHGFIQSQNGVTTDRFAFGNLLLGVNYVRAINPQFRFKVGGFLGFGPWNYQNNQSTTEGFVQNITGLATHAFQDLWYHTPNLVHLVVPARLEYDVTSSFVLTGDAQADLGIGLGNSSTGFLFIFAPGAAYWASDSFSLGLRLPLQFQSFGGDGTQVSLEPYARFELGETGFLSTRFTLNLDDPYGFSFDTGKVWGLHVALGGHF